MPALPATSSHSASATANCTTAAGCSSRIGPADWMHFSARATYSGLSSAAARYNRFAADTELPEGVTLSVGSLLRAISFSCSVEV